MNNKFEVTGNKLIVTDPCYERGTWCQGIIENAKPGTWLGTYDTVTDFFGTIVSKLVVNHESFSSGGSWTDANFEVGVDSGQAGVFDEARYPVVPEGVSKFDYAQFDYDYKGGFYNRACSVTHDPADRNVRGGVIDEGFVTSSGYGDGGYRCEYHTNDSGEVDSVRIFFVEEETDADYCEEDE